MKAPSAINEIDGLLHVALSRGFFAIVDTADRHIVEGKRWSTLVTPTGHAYACRTEKGKTILMHRELTNAPRDRQVDHEDGDGLNNRQKNLRLATPQQNMANKVVERRNRLGLKGVKKAKNRFQASIKPDGKHIHLGSYATPEEAAAAYRGAAKVLWGKFAKK